MRNERLDAVRRDARSEEWFHGFDSSTQVLISGSQVKPTPSRKLLSCSPVPNLWVCASRSTWRLYQPIINHSRQDQCADRNLFVSPIPRARPSFYPEKN